MGLLHFFLKYTKIGLAVRAVAQNKDIAYLMGINVPVFISLIFGLACALAAAAGVLIGPMQSVQVEMGYLMLMKAFAAAVVGGFGSLPGALLGGILVGIFENLGAAYISPSHRLHTHSAAALNSTRRTWRRGCVGALGETVTA